ncbi:hypothetical protein [Malikia spinosa]|uniref:Uncharacterized protein n=1 Tax=Malikia spinosa TaxID=86180 RepID=A0A7C9IZA8_9BURK|nr:hypothetical protein [Malikia spinosa]MYZ53167.1 hypothetical protein [Malikia spinosa]
MTATTIKPHPERDGDRHLRPAAYYSLALLAGAIGLSASYVTVQLFALAIRVTEPEGPTRELLMLTAALFVAAELTAMFVIGLAPVRRLRALRWQLAACAVALVAFEAVSLYGARVALVQSADARAHAGAARVEQLRASIAVNRSSAAALVAAGQRSSQSVIASSRADGAQSIREAAALEADNRRMAAELAQLEAGRTPTVTDVFGQGGVIVLAVAQSLLISCIGLLFLGAAGALARAARDARGTATTDAAPAQAAASTAAPVQQPTRTVVLPSWHRCTLPALAAGAGLLGASLAHAEPMQTPARSADAPTDAPSAQADAVPVAVDALVTAVPDAPHGTDAPDEDGARFLRVREGIEVGRIKPSLRAIYAAEGASQEVARRYLEGLEQDGVIERAGRGYALRAITSPAKKGGEA